MRVDQLVARFGKVLVALWGGFRCNVGLNGAESVQEGEKRVESVQGRGVGC